MHGRIGCRSIGRLNQHLNNQKARNDHDSSARISE